jgi:hypothetical protein
MNGDRTANHVFVANTASVIRAHTARDSAFANSIGQVPNATAVVVGGKVTLAMNAKQVTQTPLLVTLVQEDMLEMTATFAQKAGNHGNTPLICFQTPYRKTISDICATNVFPIIGGTTARHVQ